MPICSDEPSWSGALFTMAAVTAEEKEGFVCTVSGDNVLIDGNRQITVTVQYSYPRYTATLTDIYYQYDPNNKKKYENIPAEDVIAHGGKHNKVALIENPELFCNATYFYAESLFGEVFNSLDEGEIEN